jgi:hypothetical protein
VSLLLRVAALLLLAWAVILLALKGHVVAQEELSPHVYAFANNLAVANAALAFMFWYGARDPAANRCAVYGAIVFLALRLAADLYGLLVLLPAHGAAISLADLVVTLTLLVGILEALPRTVKGEDLS